MKILESRFKTELADAFKKRWPRCFVRKIVMGPFSAGLPDLYVSLTREEGGIGIATRILWIEAKMHGKVPTPLQAKTMDDMSRGGSPVWVVTCTNSGNSAVAKLVNAPDANYVKSIVRTGRDWNVQELLR